MVVCVCTVVDGLFCSKGCFDPRSPVLMQLVLYPVSTVRQLCQYFTQLILNENTCTVINL